MTPLPSPTPPLDTPPLPHPPTPPRAPLSNLALVMQRPSWGPDTHAQYPPHVRATLREVLLVAGAGRLGDAPHPMAALPLPLLLDICQLAAHPVSGWLGGAPPCASAASP